MFSIKFVKYAEEIFSVFKLRKKQDSRQNILRQAIFLDGKN